VTRLERAWIILAIVAGVTHAFLQACWDATVDRDRTLDRWPPRRPW
jgi:hypothetical protein